MTVYSGKTNQDNNTNRKQDTGVEDWMTEIWDWMDNHNMHCSLDSIVPREPEALRQLERLDLGYGKLTSYSYIDNKSVLQSESESTEPPRDCRRLNILREYDNEKTNLYS